MIARAGLAGLLLLAAPAAALAQDEGGDEGRGGESVLPPNPFAPDPLQQELRTIFHRVERNLKRIDARLADAGAGGAPLAEGEGSGLDDLLREARDTGQEVVSDIDRILEIAREMSQGQGGGGSSSQPQDASANQRQPDGTPRDREKTEEAPPEGKSPQEEGRPKQEPPGGKPESSRESDDRGVNREGDPQERAQEEPPDVAPDADRWGDLPPRVQEIFRNQGRDDLPVQYRDWIDAYYRRLNRGR
jgi:hypothetical protein